MRAVAVVLVLVAAVSGEMLMNADMESTSSWDCSGFRCTLSQDHLSGAHAISVSGRQYADQGPSQVIHVQRGHTYTVSAYMKLTTDNSRGQLMQIAVDYAFPNGRHQRVTVASASNQRTLNNWVHLTGTFTTPTRALRGVSLRFQGPEPSSSFLVDDSSLNELPRGSEGGLGNGLNTHVIANSVNSDVDRVRRTDIHFRINTARGIRRNDVTIRVLQTRRSDPFGTAVAADRYNNAGLAGYRNIIHQHFNWAVPENALKWYALEPNRGQKNFRPALDMIRGLRSHNIHVRGHNLVWSVEQYVQNWLKQLSGNTLRQEVESHFQETCRQTQGQLEHWDVNNENLHGRWYQDRLNDNDYDLELFRLARQYCSGTKLFLNDYNVVSASYSTSAYLQQAQRVKAANVGLYGLGAQGHFSANQAPNPTQIRQRLDTLAQAGLPLWITELDVVADNVNTRANYYETLLNTLYGHRSVEGILIWGFWDQAHWRGAGAALVDGNNFHINAAGQRVFSLMSRSWMTDETVRVADHGDSFTVRGFRGDYEVQVMYQGRQLKTQTFTLSTQPRAEAIDINI